MEEQKTTESIFNFDSITAKVKAFLKLDDDSKVSSFFKAVVKNYKEQIRVLKNEMEDNSRKLVNLNEDLVEKIKEAEVEEHEAFLNIAQERISTVEKRKGYIQDYDAQIDRAISNKNTYIEMRETAKTKFEEANKSIQKKIDSLEYKLSIIANL